MKSLKYFFLIAYSFSFSTTFAQADTSTFQGFWSSREIVTENKGCLGESAKQDASKRTFPGNRSWYIRGDSIYEFEYPCEFLYSFKFHITRDSLYENGNKTKWVCTKLNDNHLAVIDIGNSCHSRIEYFTRDSLSISQISLLLQNTVDLNCLTGTLKVEDDLKCPVKMPLLINIKTKEETKRLYYDSTVVLLIDHKKRDFHVKRVEWNNFDGDYAKAFNEHFQRKATIVIYPAEWWRGSYFEVKYEKE